MIAPDLNSACSRQAIKTIFLFFFLFFGAALTFANQVKIDEKLSSWRRCGSRRVAIDRKIKLPDSEFSLRLDPQGGITKKLDLAPDSIYEVTFYVRGKDIPKGGNSGARIMLGGNKRYSRLVSNSDGAPETGTFDWKKGVCQFNTSRFKTGKIEFTIKNSSSGIAWYSKVEIRKIERNALFFRNISNSSIRNVVFYPQGQWGFFLPGEAVRLNIKAAGKGKCDYIVNVRDISGKTIASGIKGSFKLPGTAVVKLPEQPRGYYVATAELKVNGVHSARIQSAFCVSDDFKKRDTFFQFGYGVYPALHDAYKRVGAGAISLKTLWLTSYKKPRPPEWLHRYNTKQHKRYWESKDFKVILNIGSSISHLFSPPQDVAVGKPLFNDRHADTLEKFLTSYVKSYGKYIDEYVVQCEIPSNATLPKFCRTWSEAMFNHMAVTRMVSRIVKKQYPKAQIWAGGNNNMRYTDSIEKIVVKDLVKDIDGYLIDAYTGNFDMTLGSVFIPETNLLKFYSDASKLSETLGLGKYIRNEETGYMAYYGAAFDQKMAYEQAYLTARTIIMTRGASVLSFELHMPTYHIHLTENRKNDSKIMSTIWKPVMFGKNIHHIPNPGGAAYITAAHHLSFAKFYKSLVNNDFYGYIFTHPEKKTVVCLWNISEAKKISLKIAKSAKLTTMTGSEKMLAPGTQTIELSQAPVYLSSTETPESLAKVIRKSFSNATPVLFAAAKRESLTSSRVFVRNARTQAVTVSVKVDGRHVIKKSLPAGKISNFTVPSGKKIELSCEGKIYDVKTDSLYIAAQKLSRKPVFDGSGNWTRQLKYEKLRHPHDVYPKEALQPERSYFRTQFSPNQHNFAADYLLAYDNENLYLAVKVDDPAHYPNDKRFRRGDSIQWVISTDNAPPAGVRFIHTPPKEYATNCDYETALTSKGALTRKKVGVISGDKFKTQVTRKGGFTFYEVAIPFKHINVDPKAGKAVRFSMDVLNKTSPADEHCPYRLAITPGVGMDAGEYRLIIFNR